MKPLKKISRLGVFLTTLITFNCVGQTDTLKSFSKRNEIGLNVGPIILVTLGNTPYPQPLGITYKRVYNKWAFRANYTFKPYDNSWFGNPNSHAFINDSTQIIKATSRKSRSQIFRAGVEYRHKFKRGWYLITGVDLSGQYTEESRHITQATFKIDTIMNYGTAEESYQTSLIEMRNLLNENTFIGQLGLGISIGAMIPVGKRWLVLAQFRADGFWGPSKTTTTDQITGKTTKAESTRFDFNTGAAISELSLFYRF